MFMAASFTSNQEYDHLLGVVETISDLSSGRKGKVGLSLDELVVVCMTIRGKVQHILAVLGKKIKRTKEGTYFYMPNLNMISKVRAAKLFYL